MKALLSILVMALFSSSVGAQEIYKWEDEKGVIHYGEKPESPKATPFKKEKAPYSNLKEGQPEVSPSSFEREIEKVPKHKRAAQQKEKQLPRPSPTMKNAKAWIDQRGDFWLSGMIHNSGKGTCETPGAEIAVIDELGSVDDRFEVTAKPNDLGRGEDAEFSGSRSAPIGDKLSWEATPRCNGVTGTFDGARKRGTLRISHSRTVKMKRLRTH